MKPFVTLLLPVIITAFYSCKNQPHEPELSVPFEKYKLENGLSVVLNEDKSDPITAVTIFYHVGSSREVPGKTGFAHLFEHMMFQKSENVGEDRLFKLIQGAGGTLNGGTNQDMTMYYEVVPKNALEMVLWLESDRMGFLSNTVTKSALVNQQNVVQNEKRQNYDNTPYGFNRGLISKNLYPEGHPYSWLTIGEMQDLTNASVEDVKSFHKKFYSPNNATLVISGDISKEEAKQLVAKYFGEIPGGEPVEKRMAMLVTLPTTRKLYHEDNLARAPQFTMVFPTVEQYSKDSYALEFLGELLAGGKKTPLYTVLVKDKKLTSRVSARNYSQELAGSFTISVSANPGASLADVEKSIFEGFNKFEKDGFTEKDITSIKAGLETSFYDNFSSVEYKASSLGEYEMNTGDPGFYKKDFILSQAVTMADVKAAFEKYIKGKNYIATSFVPKGQVNLVAEGSIDAGIVEEDVTKAAEVKADSVIEETIVKTPTKFDRSLTPDLGPDPSVKVPDIWTTALENGIKVWGINYNELPLIEYSIVIDAGHISEELGKAGIAGFVASLMNEGTKNKTPEELEDAIRLLGASIRVSSGNENITINVSTLAKHFEETIALVEEILLEPRWDEEQFDIVKNRIINTLKRNQANPDYLASTALNKLIFGENNILAIEQAGTEVSVNSITIDDLKAFYNQYFSPSIARILIAGDVEQSRVGAAFAGLSCNWVPREVVMPELKVQVAPDKQAIYFVDVPGAKQSAIAIGTPSIPRTDPDFYPLFVTNYKLGGSFNGIFNLILREEKGFTYGARSSISGYRNYGLFNAASKVRTNSTLESVTIFRTEMEKYRKFIPQEYVDFTKDALIKSNALRFETAGDLLDMLNTMTAFGLKPDFIKQEESFVKNLTVQKQLELANKYIDPSRMYYVVAGDAKTQLKELEKAGLGKPILLK